MASPRLRSSSPRPLLLGASVALVLLSFSCFFSGDGHPAAWQGPAQDGRLRGVVARSAAGPDSAAGIATAPPPPEVVDADVESKDEVDKALQPPTGKVALITGASTGIGLATVKGIAESGQYGLIVMAGRNPEKHSKAIDNVLSKVGETLASSVQLKYLDLDLSSLDSVRDCAKAFQELKVPLHTLVLNAGVMALPERRVTKEGFEYQFGVNHLAHFLLANLLLDNLVNTASAEDPGRVIALSSSAHSIPSALQAGDLSDLQQEDYSPWGAYGQSKFANLLFAYELDRKCRDRGLPVVANAVHPGVVNTELFDGDGALQGPLKTIVNGVMPFITIAPEDGAKTSVLLATSPEGKLSGRYWTNEKPAPSVDVNVGGQLPTPLQRLLPSALRQRTSYDPETWEKLWEESERLVGLRPGDVTAFSEEGKP